MYSFGFVDFLWVFLVYTSEDPSADSKRTICSMFSKLRRLDRRAARDAEISHACESKSLSGERTSPVGLVANDAKNKGHNMAQPDS